MKVSEHLAELHKNASVFHRLLAKAHEDRAASAKETADKADHEFHKAAHRAHSDAADAHDAMCEEYTKAIGVDDLSKRAAEPLPVGITSVYPAGVRPVPRAGQQAIAGPTVDPEFEKLIKLDD